MRWPTLSMAVPLLALAAGCGERRGGASASGEPAGYLGPEITFAAPPRGAILVSAGSAVPVSGQACDAFHALTQLEVLGQVVPVASPRSCTPFSLEHQSRLGLSILHAQARNDAGQLGSVARSFLRSPDYFGSGNAPGDPDAVAGSGVLLLLGPTFLDDGDRSTLNDLASVAELQLGTLDLDAVVGPVRLAQPDSNGDGAIDTHTYDCLFYSQTNKKTGFEAWKTGPLTHGPVTVDQLQLADGGLSIRVTVAGPRLPLSVMGNLDSGCLGAVPLTVDGAARADALVLEGQAAVGLDAPGHPAVTFPAFAATLVGLQLDIDLSAVLNWTGLGSVIGDAIVAEVQGPVQDGIRAAVQGQLASQLQAALAAIGGLGSSIVLPPEIGGAELIVESSLDAVDFTTQRGLLGIGLRVSAAAPRPDHLAVAALGAMRMGGERPEGGALQSSALAVGVKDDLMNQLLHAAWLAGAFDLDASALAGALLPGARLTLYANLPPVLMPKADGAPGVDLGWGDVAFVLELPSLHGTTQARGFFSAILPIDRLEAGAAGLEVVFADTVEAFAEVTSLNWGPGPAARESTTAMVEGALRNLLPQSLAGSLHLVPLPRLDLRTIDPGLPALYLSLGTAQMSRLGRYELLAGSVVATP